MNVFLAGAGGPLGKHLINAFLERGDRVTAMGYRAEEFAGLLHPHLATMECDVTQPAQLDGVCKGMDLVVSCIGITRMRGKLTHLDVDYQGNLNLLREAEKCGVRKFGFISPTGVGQDHADEVPLLDAKFLFETELRKSRLDWVIFRSGGFFPDLAGMARMAAKGPLYVVGSGQRIFTPVDVGDVARVMVEDLLVKRNAIVEIGGPEDMSWNAICQACFEHHSSKPRIVHVPVWLCHASLALLRPFSPTYLAMGKLILFMSTHDLPTEKRGKIRFSDYLAKTGPHV